MIAALLYRDDFHHLDHLAPICSLLKIPLIVTDNEIYDIASKFYPGLQITFIHEIELNLYLLENIRYLISCFTKPYLELIFFPYEKFFREKIFPIWCPHGNSDKGIHSNYFDPLKNESCLLVYGKKMLDIFKKKKLLNSNIKIIEVGNYRRCYFEKYKHQYHSIIHNEFSVLKSNQEKFLYAPTWEDFDKNSSISKYLKDLPKTIKQNQHLFIKLHPNTLKRNDLYSSCEIDKIHENSQITLIENFPPVYPLLEQIDIFLGDFSSIGYDMLVFNKPMGFLLPENKNLSDSSLFECSIDFSDFLNQNLCIQDLSTNHSKYEHNKMLLYQYTFTNNPNWKTEILNLCQ